ncbi:hypothetical protein [Kitasatospora atroaurantiaca]|uniref:hypothetical protein n=1 Tax=Kitasatospora atroaurantiaca TaxID=285545 RepID=UPI0011A50925|nr:hypothetical protein [Kitasatospora atroaurantiaca]
MASDTPVSDIARYVGYAVWGVLLPGTLVFRSLRRTPHTLVEDLVLGAVTGLALELIAWAVLMALGIQSAAILWPLAVVIPFAAVPRLRRHWRPRGYTSPSLGWSWAVAGTVALTTGYLYRVYLARNAILPTSEQSRQFIDLPYQLSLAGNAKHDFPLTLPQVADEPLHYHWFAFVHEAMTSLVGHIDLPVVEMRLMIPALCALTMLVVGVVAWRLTGRPWVGPVAALLIFAIGEFNATDPVSMPFGSPQTTLMVWASVSMTYSQPLLLALIGAIGEGLRSRGADGVPSIGRGVYVLAGLFAFASSAAKATSLPVTLAGLALAGLAVLIGTRRIPWRIVGLGATVAAGQLFSTAVVFRFESYGLKVDPLVNISGYWADPKDVRSAAVHVLIVAATWAAFLLNTQLRVIGAIPLLWRHRFRLDALQWFLLGGAIAGPAVYLTLNGWNSSYFTHTGLAFGVLLSAWGYCEVFERAALTNRAKVALAVGTLVFIGLLTYGIRTYAADWLTFALDFTGVTKPERTTYARLVPFLVAALALAAVAAMCAAGWRAASRWVTSLRGRGGIVLLSLALVAGAPTLLLDLPRPTQGPEVWGAFSLPATKVEAARWIRAHSKPSDVLLTNEHCWYPNDPGAAGEACGNNQAFTLSAFSERSVLIEGWGFAPRAMAAGTGEFWDQDLLKANDDAVYHPTAELLGRLRSGHRVRYLVVNRSVGAESPQLKTLAAPVYDNGRIGVYELH